LKTYYSLGLFILKIFAFVELIYKYCCPKYGKNPEKYKKKSSSKKSMNKKIIIDIKSQVKEVKNG